MKQPKPGRCQFRTAPCSEPLAIDRRVSAFGLFEEPERCEYLPEAVIDGVAVLAVSGPLEHRQHWLFTSYEEIAKQIAGALADETVRAVVLKIDSPGGIAAGMDEMHKRLRAMRAQYDKPIYAYVDEQACSAAYHLASACDEIWLPESGEVGSVGVILCTVDETRALKKAGVKVRYVVTGERKADLHPGQPVDDAVIQVMQERVDYLGNLFFAAVANGRGMTPEAVAALEAGVFQGESAIAIALADGIASWEEFLGVVKESSDTNGSSRATMGPPPERSTTSTRGSAMKLLQLTKAAADAKAAYQAALKATAKSSDKKTIAAARAALDTKLKADSALAAAQAKTTTVKHLKHEEKVTVKDDDEEKADDDEEEEEEESEEEDSDAGSDADSSAASSTGSMSSNGSETGSEEEEEEEKAAAKAFGPTAGLHTPYRLLRLARQVTGVQSKSVREVFGALDAIGQRVAKTAKLEKRLEKLEGESRALKVDGMIERALSAGKITKAQVPDLRTKGMQDRGFLKGFLATLPKVYRTTAEGEAFVPRADTDGNPIGAPDSDAQKILAAASTGMSTEEATKFRARVVEHAKVNGKPNNPTH